MTLNNIIYEEERANTYWFNRKIQFKIYKEKKM